MPEFELPGWQETAKAFLNKSIGDPTVPSKLFTTGVSHDFPMKVGGFAFSIQPQAEVRAVVFNSKNDVEDDPMEGVIGNEDDESGLGPQILFNEKHAWLAYHVRAGVKAEGGGDIGVLGLNIEGEKVVRLCDYRFHKDRSETIKDAVPADIARARFALRQSDLKQLEIGDALAYRVSGKLSATVEASLSDVLTANLNGLSSFLRTNTPLAIKLKFGADMKFNVGLTDDFLVVFSRESEGRIRVGVKKGKVSSLSASAGAGIQVQLANPEVLSERLNEILEGIAGEQVDRIDALLKKNVVSQLTDEEKSIFGRLLHRLKLDDNLTDLASLRTHWEKLTEQVTDKVKSLAGTKVAAAFRYEYSRVKSESTLLQIVVPGSILIEDKELHFSLIKTDLTTIIQWCRDTNVAPEKYMHERKLTVNKAWGLSISLGKFTIGGKDIERLEDVTRKNFSNEEQVTFLGQRGYEGTWVGQKVNWMADFQAGMKTFEKPPRLSDFDFGFAFKWLWEEKQLSQEEVDMYLDYAEIWRAINSDTDPRKELSRFIGNTVKIGLDVKIDDFAFRQLLKATNGASTDQFAAAMAKAMPWDTQRARSIVERRTRLYSPLWTAYLNNPHASYRNYAATAQNHLRQLEDGAEVAFLEGNINDAIARTSWNRSFAEMIRLNGTEASNDLSGIRSDWEHFREAVQTLNDGISANASPTHLKGVFKDFCQLWSNSLQLRAVGVYWIDLAASLSLLSHVERTLSVEVPDKDPKKSLHIKIGIPSS